MINTLNRRLRSQFGSYSRSSAYADENVVRVGDEEQFYPPTNCFGQYNMKRLWLPERVLPPARLCHSERSEESSKNTNDIAKCFATLNMTKMDAYRTLLPLVEQEQDRDHQHAPAEDRHEQRTIAQQHFFRRAAFATLVHQVHVAEHGVDHKRDRQH